MSLQTFISLYLHQGNLHPWKPTQHFYILERNIPLYKSGHCAQHSQCDSLNQNLDLRVVRTSLTVETVKEEGKNSRLTLRRQQPVGWHLVYRSTIETSLNYVVLALQWCDKYLRFQEICLHYIKGESRCGKKSLKLGSDLRSAHHTQFRQECGFLAGIHTSYRKGG